MADDANPLRMRDGLPPAESGDHFFGFGPNGETYALAWDAGAEAWQAVGFGREGRPVAILVRDGDAAIARTMVSPIALLGQTSPARQEEAPVKPDAAPVTGTPKPARA